MSKLPNADIEWSRGLLATLNTGGVWCVPRSGLIFTKTGEKSMELRVLMPFSPEMAYAADEGRDAPGTEEDLLEWQMVDYRCIAERFRAAGIEVSDKTGLMAKKKGQG